MLWDNDESHNKTKLTEYRQTAEIVEIHIRIRFHCLQNGRLHIQQHPTEPISASPLDPIIFGFVATLFVVL